MLIKFSTLLLNHGQLCVGLFYYIQPNTKTVHVMWVRPSQAPTPQGRRKQWSGILAAQPRQKYHFALVVLLICPSYRAGFKYYLSGNKCSTVGWKVFCKVFPTILVLFSTIKNSKKNAAFKPFLQLKTHEMRLLLRSRPGPKCGCLCITLPSPDPLVGWEGDVLSSPRASPHETSILGVFGTPTRCPVR